ncbi:hypothetical protein L4D08_13435 [Photobacterium chitinilyticum]
MSQIPNTVNQTREWTETKAQPWLAGQNTEYLKGKDTISEFTTLNIVGDD